MDEQTLRKYITEAIKASPDYLKKEAVRGRLENIVYDLVSTGEIGSQKDLDNFFRTVDLAATALKMVPFEVYASISKKK